MAWIWALFFAYITPEIQAFLRSLRCVLFKTWMKPLWYEFVFVACMECTSAIGQYCTAVSQSEASFSLPLS